MRRHASFLLTLSAICGLAGCQSPEEVAAADAQAAARFREARIEREAQERVDATGNAARADKERAAAAADDAARDATQRRAAAARAKALAAVYRSRDEVEGMTWYWGDRASESRSGTFVGAYFGVFAPGGIGPLRFVVQYAETSFVFARGLVMNADGTVYHLTPTTPWKREVEHGLRTEKLDIPITLADSPLNADNGVKRISGREFLTALMNAKVVTMRFKGDDKAFDFRVPKRQIAAIRTAYDAWRALSDQSASALRD